MSLLRRAIASVLSGVLAFGQPAEVLAASYVFRQASTAGTFPVPTITNNVVTAATYYKIDGRSYSISWQGTGGRSPYQLEMVGSPLPPGCTTPIQTGSILTANCVFTTEGNFGGVMAQLTDANGMVLRDNAPNIVVTAPAPTLNTYSFPFSGYVATPYKGSLKVSGGRQPFNASRATGQLPPGLSLAMVQDVNTGAWSVELSGTPTTLGSYTFDILLTDANQKQVTSSKINVSVGFGPVSLALRPSTPTGVFKVMAGQPIGNAGVSIVGGTPPISLSQQTGVLPIGLSIGSDGRLVGTPTVVGTTSGIQIRAVDAATPSRTATSAAFTVQVVNGLSATVISGNAPYLVNQPISPITTVPNGGTGPYSYSLAGDLPPGISFSKTNGQFTGTPTVAGRYPGLVVTVRDADGFTTDAAAFAMTVANPLTIAGDAPRGVAGNPYTATFTASGGTGPYGFTLASGDLPFGLSLASDGTISGTPFVAGTTDGLVVRVTDANGSTKDKGPFSIVLADALAVATTPARSATRGVAYSSAFTAAGGTAPYGFALVSGTLPPGLSLATGGTVSGTPTTVGSYGPLTVRLVDAEGHTATGETTIVVSAPVAIAGSAGRGTLGQPYAAAFTATGGAGPYAFSLAAGALPLGLSLASDGTISGTPTAAGTAAGIVVRVADADGRTDQTQAFSIVVDAPLRIAGTPSAVATLGQTYSASFAASGGTGPYTFALATGTLPAGLALAGSGTITGAPTTTGVSENLSVKVTDAAGRTVSSETFRIAVGTVLAVSGSASTLATAGQAYAAQFAAAGGSAPYAWTLASGTLPPGLSLDSSTGLVGGTPTTLGSYPGIQVRASDADGRTALSSIFGISVSSSLAISGAPSVSATVGQPYSAQFTATGGAGTKTFSLATGQLPAGLSFDTATGLISGTPTTKGFSPSIAVRVRDETNSAATAQAFDLYVSDPLVVSGIPTPDAIVGAAYSGNAAVAGGRPAYAWTLDAGTLPPGLQLSAVTGVVSGTPTTPGTTSGLRLRATDVDGRTGVTAAFAITVAAPLTIAGQAGPGTVGAAYAATFAADGGTLPYSYEIVGAALPAGLTLDAATGTISGQPTAASAGGTMQMRVTDAKGRTASTASFAIDVRDPFRLVGSNLGPATIGLAYSGVMAPAGGRGPFVLSLAAGSLPPGLTLEPGTGVIAGTPTAPGSYAGIVIAGVDADGRTARSAAFTIEVADGISIAGIPPQPATVGVPYDFAFTARGGQAPYTFALTGGNLPGGMTLDGGTGGMGGSPNRAGIVTNLTVTAMDRARRTAASLPFTIDVRDPVSVSGTPPLVATTGRPYTASFAAVGGRGPFAFAMVGTLPAGLTLNATSGTITGSATTVDDVAGLRVRATDQDGRVGISDPFAISVAAPLTLAGTPSPSADVGAPYAAKFTAAGGKQPYAFAVKAGILPTGLVLDPAGGGIDGTPNATGTFPDIQIQVVDANGTTTVSQSFTVVVSDPLSAIVQVGPGTVGQTYAGLVATTGGRGPFSYALAAGTLPAGLQIDAVSGRISGTPRSAGVAANLQIRVSDADARSVLTSSFSISVSAPLTLAGLGIPSALATLGRTYDSAVTANGGQGPYSYTLSEGVLPAGLTLDGSSGRISGTPTVVGAAEGLRISASDSEGRAVASSVFHIDVRDPVVLTGDPADFGTIGQTYAASFAASGGRGPYSFSLVGTLPAGLGLNASTGAVAGIPTRVGDASGLQIRAVDQDGRVGISRAFDIHISPSLSIVGSLPPAATVGLAYAGGYTGRDGSGPYSFALVAGALPDGLSFDAETGQVSGTPNAIGTSAGLQVRVTDRNGRVATAPAVSIIVSDPLVASISPSPAIRNVAFSAQVATTGGRGPLGFTLSAGALPAGLTLNAGTGVIGGTPTTVQVASGLQVRVTDADGRAVSTQTFSISVAPALTLALSSNLPGTIGTAFSAQATAAGGRPTYAYAVTAGSLPPGLQLDEATGRISGTPSAIGRTAITITTTDADGRSAQASSTIAVAEPLQLVVRASDTPATVGQAFNQTFVGVGGRATYVYAVTGTLPPGLTLNASTGVLAGTPTTAGLYGNLVIRVTDADGRSQSSAAFAIDVRAAMAFSGTGVPSGIATVGLSYASSVSAAGGRSPYRYTVAAGTLPAGLVLDGSIGQIAGTPTQVETATGLRIAVSDADGRSFVGPVFQIDVRQPVVVAGAAASIGTISQTYGPHAFAAAGGRGPYTYAMVGTLPAGLSLSSSGTLSGTPSATGSFSGLQVRATDADGRTGLSSQFAIIVSRALTISSNTPTAATVGTSYSGSYTAANGRQPYVFGVAAGTLPSGLSIDPASGQIAGTPTTAGTFPGIQVRVTDVDGRNATAAAVAIIVSNPLSASASPTPAVRSSAYSTQIAVQGGRSNYSYVLASGTLPAGLTLGAATGTISGTPTTQQVASGLQVRVTDADGRTTLTPAFTISVAPPLSLSLANPIQATVGAALSNSANPAGGRPPYAVSLSSGALPPGISLDAATGAIAGTTSSTGTFAFAVTAMDADARNVSASSSIVVQAPVSVGPPTNTDGMIGTIFSASVSTSGGSGSYTFALAAGSLPPGLLLISVES